jgi:hypothetical protein
MRYGRVLFGLALLCFVCLACAVEWKSPVLGVKYLPGSRLYGTKYTEGFFGTHSSGHYSLYVKHEKNWKLVWRGVGGWPQFAWENAALFTATTSESGEAKVLLHSTALGSVVINDEIYAFKANALQGRKSTDLLAGRTRWSLEGESIVWSAPDDSPSAEVVQVKIKITDLEAMAAKGLSTKKKRVFRGNEFFE